MSSAANLIILGNQLAWMFPWQVWGHSALQIGNRTYEKHPGRAPFRLHQQPLDQLVRDGAPKVFGLQRTFEVLPLNLSPQETEKLQVALEKIDRNGKPYEPLTNNCAITLKDALVEATHDSALPVHNPWHGFLNDRNPFGYAPGDLAIQLRKDGRLLDQMA